MKDELLSHWLVRLAWNNRQKLNHFTWKQLGLPKMAWYRDIDRWLNEDHIDQIATLSGTALARARQTSLRSWQGVLWESLETRGGAQWLMQVKSVGRIKKLAGQQYCPHCLTSGTPYFRKSWRLIIPFCSLHMRWLLDRCQKCASPINFHSGDYGWSVVGPELRSAYCGKCGHDLRLCTTAPVPPTLGFYNLVQQIDLALGGQWAVVGDEELHPLPFFRGLRILLCVLASNKAPRRVRERAAEQGAPLAFRTARNSLHLVLEQLEIEERARLFSLLAWILEDWPYRFIDTFREARIRSDWFRRSWQVPWWLEKRISTDLNGTFYRPSPHERASATAYLSSQGQSISRNSLRRALGLSFVEDHKYFKNR